MDVTIFIAFYKEQDYEPANSTFKAEIDAFQILATFIQKANAKNLADFLSTT